MELLISLFYWVGVIVELFHAIFLLTISFLNSLNWIGRAMLLSGLCYIFNSCSFSSEFVWSMNGGAGYL